MLTSRFIIHAAIIVFAAVTYVCAVPIQMHGETLGLSPGIYTQPELAEELERSYAALAGTGENGHVSQFSRQTRHGLDSLSGATFGESKRYTPLRKLEWPNNINGLEIYEGSAKRNIDEIDRTGFDNFLKRNFDEIDRSGWDSFVKRRMIDSYLTSKQH